MAIKVLVSGYIGFNNFGDDIIFERLVKYLKSRGAYVSALSANPSQTARNYGVFAYYYKNLLQIIKCVMNSDILVSGGGSLLQNQTSDKSLIYYLFIIFLAKLFRKKVIIFAQGLEGIEGFFQQFFSKFLLSRCNLITVRDSYSQILLRKWKMASVLVCDPFYDVKLPEYKPDGTVGVQVRESSNLSPMFLGDFAKNIVKKFPDRKINIFIFQQEKDETPALSLMMHIKKHNPAAQVEIISHRNHHDLIDDFSHLKYLYAMRYHACLLGLKFGVKVLPIAYDYKIMSLVKEYKLNCIDCSMMTQNMELDGAKRINDIEKKFDWSTYDYFIY